MKMNLKKRCLLFALCLILLLPLLSVGASAGKDKPDFEYDANDCAVWELSDDGRTLKSGSLSYTSYQFPVGSPAIYEEAQYLFQFQNRVSSPWIEEITGSSYAEGIVYSAYPGGGTMLLQVEGEWYLYVDAIGKAEMDAFASGQTKNYYLRTEPYESTPLDATVFSYIEEELGKTDNKRSEDVVNLKAAHRFDVIVYDEYQTYAYTVGAVYRLQDGKDYYVHYLTLENQYFDADGNFSYRSGSVELTALDPKITEELDQIAQNIPENGYTYYGYEGENWDFMIPVAGFWVLYSLFGFAAPLPLLIAGLVLPRSKKRGYPKHWYVLSFIAMIWIIIALALMILLI